MQKASLLLIYHDLEKNDPYTGCFQDHIQQRFPANEQVSMSSIFSLANEREPENVLQCVINKDQNSVVGIVWEERDTEQEYSCLWYLATSTSGNGLGTRIYHDICNRNHELGIRVLLFEVEHPDHAVDRDLARRRIAWYQRQGALLCKNIHYRQAVGWKVGVMPPTTMYLMCHQIAPVASSRLIEMIYDCFADGIENTVKTLILE